MLEQYNLHENLDDYYKKVEQLHQMNYKYPSHPDKKKLSGPVYSPSHFMPQYQYAFSRPMQRPAPRPWHGYCHKCKQPYFPHASPSYLYAY
ncbi:hypothetical protein [Pseudalkalibacillus berkeleyi]|uniref:Uncharacterized protein n=1 Tax=Pseudalkalibacillus berkeleyi TaxID=1069813 RepID=A0ABS9H0Y7_9BACL|nr:hypothetical protein [Pseudalkalibacillus berkeleyi]MCF6137508.1 hypothetical protein [Pseudalkalibacillus berkeleyi]